MVSYHEKLHFVQYLPGHNYKDISPQRSRPESPFPDNQLPNTNASASTRKRALPGKYIGPLDRMGGRFIVHIGGSRVATTSNKYTHGDPGLFQDENQPQENENSNNNTNRIERIPQNHRDIQWDSNRQPRTVQASRSYDPLQFESISIARIANKDGNNNKKIQPDGPNFTKPKDSNKITYHDNEYEMQERPLLRGRKHDPRPRSDKKSVKLLQLPVTENGKK